MKKITAIFTSIILFTGLSFAVISANAADVAHKVVIQVSSKDPLIQKIALNNAVNIQKSYGIDNVTVEIVAYGPGLSMLTKKSKQAERIQSLAMSNITFSACGNTIKKIKKKKGKEPKLIKGVKVVSSGVRRIMDLQEQGYSYIRP